MIPRSVLHALGFLLVLVAAGLLLSTGVSLLYREESWVTLFLPAVLSAAVGALLFAATRGGDRDIGIRGGFMVVAFGWILLSFAGALPYLFSGALHGISRAFFETMSGFTTTGSTLLSGLDDMDRGLLFWRALTQWIGGMGIVVLGLAILPALGVGGLQLMGAEVPGITADKLRPRISQTAAVLWTLYLGITALETALLALGGMSLFDAVTHSFTTMATGGFSTRDLSVGAYHSAYIEWVVTIFMIVAGANFALHFGLLRRDLLGYWKNEEFRLYALILLGAILAVAITLRAGTIPSTERSVREAAFQVASLMTTTGYATADYERWPGALQAILLGLMFIGGCAGSTGGSVKVVRILLLFKAAAREMERILRPRTVRPIRLGSDPVSPVHLTNTAVFFFLYGLSFAAGTAIVWGAGADLTTAASAVAACLGNVGPGLGDVGPLDNFAAFGPGVLWTLSILMLVGRLEIFTVLVLFHPHLWRR